MSFDFWSQNLAMFWEGTLETLYMTALSTLFAYAIGLPLGVLLVTSKPGGIKPQSTLNFILGGVVNIGRSIPFIILMVFLIPVTKLILGRITGPSAAIIPLVVAAAPFVARLVESSLEELDNGVVEAAKTMGATNKQIILKVLLPESVPSLVRGIPITIITLVSYAAMAGAVGAGGLGDIAIRYGYHRYDPGAMWVTLILLVVLVQIIQSIFNVLAKRIDKRNVK